jgi:serine phosphatase RsbU (regulator of sigma subunit)
MLGIPLHQDIEDHTAPLPPGSTLALYTDGLVERRAQGIDPGIERLTVAMAGLTAPDLDGDLERAADRVLDPMLRDSERDDDVCLLLCHVNSESGNVAVPTRAGRP